ncbi:hypothetical protein EJ08DRAFT_90065 [Tothia fuscella]|uniref:Uncharacterized protein n=1 Tax=Tothia fuscella TaxID=1048955 RepID=A0A9P4U023_9PEZI|nr:hypothetical protein EJ08DRAFT_90065 [Tothia fuscella]
MKSVCHPPVNPSLLAGSTTVVPDTVFFFFGYRFQQDTKLWVRTPGCGFLSFFFGLACFVRDGKALVFAAKCTPEPLMVTVSLAVDHSIRIPQRKVR